MEITVGKITAAVIAIGYIVAFAIAAAGGHVHDVKSVLGLLALVVLSLGLIWFPEEIGSYTGGVSRGSKIDAETPPFMVSFLGWMFLVGFPVLALFLG